MIGRGKNSLSCLKMSICKELGALKAHSSPLKKSSAGKDNGTPVKIASKMSESIVSSAIRSKDSVSALKHIVNRARKDAKGKPAGVPECARKI